MSTHSFTQKLKVVLPYIADVGAVAYVTVSAFALVVVIAEFFSPGLVASAVAPQALVAGMLVCGAIALFDVTPKPSSRAGLIVYALLGAGAAAFAFWAAWYYFSPVPDVRGRLASAIGLVVGLLFAASATPVPEEV